MRGTKHSGTARDRGFSNLDPKTFPFSVLSFLLGLSVVNS